MTNRKACDTCAHWTLSYRREMSPGSFRVAGICKLTERDRSTSLVTLQTAVETVDFYLCDRWEERKLS